MQFCVRQENEVLVYSLIVHEATDVDDKSRYVLTTCMGGSLLVNTHNLEKFIYSGNDAQKLSTMFMVHERVLNVSGSRCSVAIQVQEVEHSAR